MLRLQEQPLRFPRGHQDPQGVCWSSPRSSISRGIQRHGDRWAPNQPQILLLHARHPHLQPQPQNCLLSCFLRPEQELNKYCKAPGAVPFNRLRQTLSARAEGAASDSKQNKEGFNSQRATSTRLAKRLQPPRLSALPKILPHRHQARCRDTSQLSEHPGVPAGPDLHPAGAANPAPVWGWQGVYRFCRHGQGTGCPRTHQRCHKDIERLCSAHVPI